MKLNAEDVRKYTILGVEAEIARLQEVVLELQSQFAPKKKARAKKQTKRGRRRMTPEQRAKHSKLMKERWAKKRAAKEEGATAPTAVNA